MEFTRGPRNLTGVLPHRCFPPTPLAGSPPVPQTKSLLGEGCAEHDTKFQECPRTCKLGHSWNYLAPWGCEASVGFPKPTRVFPVGTGRYNQTGGGGFEEILPLLSKVYFGHLRGPTFSSGAGTPADVSGPLLGGSRWRSPAPFRTHEATPPHPRKLQRNPVRPPTLIAGGKPNLEKQCRKAPFQRKPAPSTVGHQGAPKGGTPPR